MCPKWDVRGLQVLVTPPTNRFSCLRGHSTRKENNRRKSPLSPKSRKWYGTTGIVESHRDYCGAKRLDGHGHTTLGPNTTGYLVNGVLVPYLRTRGGVRSGNLRRYICLRIH